MSKLFLFSKVKEMKMKIPKGYISGTLLGHGQLVILWGSRPLRKPLRVRKSQLYHSYFENRRNVKKPLV